MNAVRRQVSRQGDALAVILLALLSVILYTLWGASVLQQEQANGSVGTVAVVNS
jgi:hypothetical protein